jgi:tRNA-specific 2-thiouridylase
MKLYHNEDIGHSSESTCCSLADIEDARAVANQLGIDHHVFNFSQLFGAQVIDRFVHAYQTGQTPNPCIDCNRYVKFPHMWLRAKQLGYDSVATGHYARLRIDESTGRTLLLKSQDSTKDQTYVLYNLPQDILSHSCFPLGDLTKLQVREIAQASKLQVAHKSDSQDICFVPDKKYTEFLTQTKGCPNPPGPVVNAQGEFLGTHHGLLSYTIGQRRHVDLSLGEKAYVLSKDPTTNTLVLGSNEETYSSACLVSDCNWIAIDSLETKMEISVKVRYSQNATKATIEPLESGMVLCKFEEKVRAVTSGQAAVFYDGDSVVGGGTIQSAIGSS